MAACQKIAPLRQNTFQTTITSFQITRYSFLVKRLNGWFGGLYDGLDDRILLSTHVSICFGDE